MLHMPLAKQSSIIMGKKRLPPRPKSSDQDLKKIQAFVKDWHDGDLEVIRDDVSCPTNQPSSKLKLSLFACPGSLGKLTIAQQVSESSAISTEMTQDHYITEPRHAPSLSNANNKQTLTLPLSQTQKYLTAV